MIELEHSPIINKFKGYLGNPNIKKAGISIEWTEENLIEYSKCKKDPIYFAEKYMKIVDADGELINFKLYDYQREIITALHTNRRLILLQCRQSGKALPLDTYIPTPNGWKFISELNIGDKVFDENGNETVVSFTSEIFTDHTCYKITFDDRSSIIADANHIWTVYKSSSSLKSSYNKTTEELFNSNFLYEDSRKKKCSRWKIPLSKPVKYPYQNIHIDPYTLGLWLGGGASYGISPELRKLNLLNNKHVPNSYLFNTIEVRLELLRGLMDSDGYVDTNGSNGICFSTKYPLLLDTVYELLTSLGFKVFRKKKTNVNAETLHFHCSREMFDIYKLPRKLNNQLKTSQSKEYTSNRYIRNIEKVDSVPTKCIQVTNSSHLFLCSKHYIPTHNSTTIASYILWYILFNKTKNVAILGNTGATAQEILKKIQDFYEYIPLWLQQGVIEWNKTSIELENKSRILTGPSTKASLRGKSIQFMLIDEAAFVQNWEEFYTSTFNTMANSKKAKIAMISTPNGVNHFTKFWEGATHKDVLSRNGWYPVKVIWSDVPGRDENWKKEILKGTNFDYEKFDQEHMCSFLGSSGTLISGHKLKDLLSSITIPINHGNGSYQYELPRKDRSYTLICDVSRGRGLDYSTIQVIDTKEFPYKQVFSYRDNLITPLDFADVIHRIAKTYNNGIVLIEINDVGSQVSESLFYDFEYENVLMTENNGRNGKQISAGFGGKEKDFGIRTTKTVKAIGCSILKLLVEQNKLLLRDKNTIDELTTFSRKGNSYEAESGNYDDMVMPLVLFAWLTDQMYFKELTDINTLQLLREKTEEQMMEEMLPFGFEDDGMDENDIDEPKTVSSIDDWLLS